jgi:hypothetical protein
MGLGVILGSGDLQPLEQIVHGVREESFPGHRFDPTGVEFFSNRPGSRFSGGSNIFYHRSQGGSEIICPLPVLSGSIFSGDAQFGSTFLGGGKGKFRSNGYRPAFFFGNGGEDLNSESICIRIVDSNEFNAGFHEGGDEVQVPGKAVQSGDQER